jgi:hypothetical protein
MTFSNWNSDSDPTLSILVGHYFASCLFFKHSNEILSPMTGTEISDCKTISLSRPLLPEACKYHTLLIHQLE